MKSGNAAWAVLLASCAAPAQSPEPAAQPGFSVAVSPPSTSSAATGPQVSGYAQAYAGPERSSYVTVRRFVPKRLEKVASFTAKQPHIDDSYPRFVLPAPSGAFALVDPGESRPLQVFEVGGGLASAEVFGLAGFVVSNEGYADARSVHAWRQPKPRPFSGSTLIVAIDGPRTMRLHTRQLHAEANRDGYATATEGDHVYQATLDGELVGALSASRGAVVVEAQTSRVSIFPPPFALEPGTWQPSVVREVGKPNQGIYEVSILRDGIALVADMVDKGGGSGFERKQRDRPQWPSSVIVLDQEGTQLYRIDLPWSVAMPVIDLGPGRIAVAGSHLVVYQQGREVWRLEGGPVRATAFADGSLAVTKADELLVFDPDGKELARLRAPAPDPPVERRVFRTTPQGSRLGEIIALPNDFTTPPAIAADGSIWAASAWELLIAR